MILKLVISEGILSFLEQGKTEAREMNPDNSLADLSVTSSAAAP